MMSKPIATNPELLKRIRDSVEAVKNMSAEERTEMWNAQRESWARSCITDRNYTYKDGKVVKKDIK